MLYRIKGSLTFFFWMLVFSQPFGLLVYQTTGVFIYEGYFYNAFILLFTMDFLLFLWLRMMSGWPAYSIILMMYLGFLMFLWVDYGDVVGYVSVVKNYFLIIPFGFFMCEHFKLFGMEGFLRNVYRGAVAAGLWAVTEQVGGGFGIPLRSWVVGYMSQIPSRAEFASYSVFYLVRTGGILLDMHGQAYLMLFGFSIWLVYSARRSLWSYMGAALIIVGLAMSSVRTGYFIFLLIVLLYVLKNSAAFVASLRVQKTYLYAIAVLLLLLGVGIYLRPEIFSYAVTWFTFQKEAGVEGSNIKMMKNMLSVPLEIWDYSPFVFFFGGLPQDVPEIYVEVSLYMNMIKFGLLGVVLLLWAPTAAMLEYLREEKIGFLILLFWCIFVLSQMHYKIWNNEANFVISGIPYAFYFLSRHRRDVLPGPYIRGL